jgi:hypothetical protein
MAATRSRRPLPLLAAPGVVVVVLAGLWLTGAAITNDFRLAMWLTFAWMAVAGAACCGIALRSRRLRWPVLAAYVLTALVAAVYLGRSQLFDTVVHERVATAPAGARTAQRGNARLRAGRFAAVRHDARGTATAIRLARGGRVLTLTDFDVTNGPDLRVYLVAGRARTEGDVRHVVDLGALKGNQGDQQYDIPRRVDLERYSTAVIWCRAFSVLFARAPLG